MLRGPLVLSLAITVASGSALAQVVRVPRSIPSVGQPVVSLPAVTFTPGPLRLDGLTFTPGPLRLDGVTFTPGRLSIRHVPSTPAATQPTSARVPVRTSRLVSHSQDAPRRPGDNTHHPAPAPTREPSNREGPVPSTTDTLGCTLSGDIARIDLDLSPPAALRPVQVALATHGHDAIALVTIARPGGPREGMVFTTSRLVWLPGDGSMPRVYPAPGFEPDVSIALGPGGRVLAVGYTRLDVRSDLAHSQRSIRVVPLDIHGRRVGTERLLEDSSGLEIDSPVVPFGQPFEGFAVVLGRKVTDTPETPGSVREYLYTFGEHGQSLYPPVLVTDLQSDETLGRYRIGLGTASGRGDLTVAWTITRGTDTGVWYRHGSPDHLGPATRRLTRNVWGVQLAHDGSGLLYRTGGERDAPVQLFYAPWEGTEEFSLAAGWDPSLAFVRGRALIAAAAMTAPEGTDVSTLVSVARPGVPPRPIPTPSNTLADLARAIDLDLAATEDGAVVAWIEPTLPGDDTAPRRLAVARVTCR